MIFGFCALIIFKFRISDKLRDAGSNCRYDGQRAQIHLLPDGSIRIFSRNGEDNTSRFPDVLDIVRNAMQPEANIFIIDAEVC